MHKQNKPDKERVVERVVLGTIQYITERSEGQINARCTKVVISIYHFLLQREERFLFI